MDQETPTYLIPVPRSDQAVEGFRRFQTKMGKRMWQGIVLNSIIVITALILGIATNRWDAFLLFLLVGSGLYGTIKDLLQVASQPLPLVHHELTSEGIRRGTSLGLSDVQWGETFHWKDIKGIQETADQVILDFGIGKQITLGDTCFHHSEEPNRLQEWATCALPIRQD